MPCESSPPSALQHIRMESIVHLVTEAHHSGSIVAPTTEFISLTAKAEHK